MLIVRAHFIIHPFKIFTSQNTYFVKIFKCTIMCKCISSWKRKAYIFNGLYLFNLYPITNWPFRLNPSPCPWPFPIDGYKKRVMLGFWLSVWIPDGNAGAAGGVAALLQVEVKVNVLVFHWGFWHWLAGVVQLEMMMGVTCVWEDIDREQVAKILRGKLTNLWRNSVARFIVTRAATATASTERSPCGEGKNCVFVWLCLYVPACLWKCV